MDTADLLVELMFSWMEQREECANKLEKLAQELETHRENCNISQTVGSTTAVVGSVGLIGAGLATVFTGGAAAPLIGLAAGVVTGLGVGVSSITKLVEHLIESKTMKDAMKAESEGHKITERIQRLFEELKEECKKTNFNADDQEQYTMTEIVGAIAKQSGLDHHSIKHTFQRHSSHDGPGAMGIYMNMTPPRAMGELKNIKGLFLQPALLVGLAGVLTIFGLEAHGKRSKTLFIKGAELMIKEVSKTGVKTILKGGAMAVGGAIVFAFELREAINHWKDLIKKNNVTEASKSLKDTADALRQLNRTLRAQLDKIKQMLEELDQLKCCIENNNRSLKQKKNFIRIVKKYCQDQAILNWLSETDDTKTDDTEILLVFLFLFVDLFYLLKQELDKNKQKIDRKDIDIIFVAHGEIQEPLIPAMWLLPLSPIEDVILYSPWNCAIDANIAYGIATGDLQTKDRIFCCGPDCGCSDDDRHKPESLDTRNWNSMREAGDSMIANILVSPLDHPKDPAWNTFLILEGKFGEPGKNRVVIPYIIPGHDGGDLMTIPFPVVTLALSLVLLFSPFTARVHLAACLGRSSETTLTELFLELKQQYLWTKDDTYMTAKTEAPIQFPELYKALRAEFD